MSVMVARHSVHCAVYVGFSSVKGWGSRSGSGSSVDGGGGRFDGRLLRVGEPMESQGGVCAR